MWLTISPGLAVAKEVAFEGDGKSLLTATLEAKKGRQEFPLPAPATFRELKLTVRSTYPGQNEWGSISEIEGFDKAGQNVLLSPPRHEPRAEPEAVLAKYREIKAADPERPVFMTVTGNFHPHFGKWTDQQRNSLYAAYFQAADILGYDIYPIYGWNKPEWIHLVHEATELLAQQAGQRPLYAWIETSKGGQWTGALEDQKDVTPAHIKAEVWMSICRGATAIGYFTHVWKPSYHQFGVPEQNRTAPAGNQCPDHATGAGDPERRTGAGRNDPDGGRCQAGCDGQAARRQPVPIRGELRSARRAGQGHDLRSGTAGGSGDRSAGRASRHPAQAGSFCDEFGPLAVHLYRVKQGN